MEELHSPEKALDETYYGNFVASHPLPHFGSCAHQGIEKIQPSMPF